MDSLSHDQFVLLSVTLWAIWSARCKAINEGIFQTPQGTFYFIKSFISELDQLKEIKPVHALHAQSTEPQRPKAPLVGYAKIHVDASVRKGEVFRDLPFAVTATISIWADQCW